jgi:hypothetical protein
MFAGIGVIVAVMPGRGVIVVTAVGNTAGGSGVEAGDVVGTRIGDGVGHGTGVPLDTGVGDGDGTGVADTVGAGVGVIDGLMVILRSVGMGRGVGIGSSGKPVGSREMLCRVRSLMPAPTSTLAMGSTYRIIPIKMTIAKKFSSALSIGLPLQDGPVPDQLIL